MSRYNPHFKGTGTAAKTGHKVVHHKADGTTEIQDVKPDGSRVIITKDTTGSYSNVIVKDRKGQKKVAYNFGPMFGGSLSKKEREDEINKGLNAYRSEYRSTGGMTKGGNMKHVASIPPEIYYSEMMENGQDSVRDPKHLKKLVSEWGFGVSGRRR